jgi:hypothetical protein
VRAQFVIETAASGLAPPPESNVALRCDAVLISGNRLAASCIRRPSTTSTCHRAPGNRRSSSSLKPASASSRAHNAGRVQSLRHHYEIPYHTPTDDPQEAELLSVTKAAKELGLAPSTLHRWLADGFVAGEQLTLGAPWRIRLTDEIRSLFVDDGTLPGDPTV